MYIVNKYGILMSIPEDMTLPVEARKATAEEIACFEETGEQNVAKMTLEAKIEKKGKVPAK